MSQHSLMSTQERKMQAAAICREIHATDEPEMDLGKKVSAPKEIMLEELSLASNRGSRLFKMRQKRSEKYTFESIQNEVNTQHSNNAIHPGPDIFSNVNDLGDHGDQEPKTVNNDPNPENIAPGYGGPLKDVPAEKFNSTAMPRSYQSPWEQALINNPTLADTLVAQMPEPEPKHEIPQYKSFNRVAIPFGGFGTAPKVTAKPVDVELPVPNPIAPVDDPVIKRPTFNRTASGWVHDSLPLRLPNIHLEPISSMSSTFAPESDEL